MQKIKQQQMKTSQAGDSPLLSLGVTALNPVNLCKIGIRGRSVTHMLLAFSVRDAQKSLSWQ